MARIAVALLAALAVTCSIGIGLAARRRLAQRAIAGRSGAPERLR
jgi:hypothetical protein